MALSSSWVPFPRSFAGSAKCDCSYQLSCTESHLEVGFRSTLPEYVHAGYAHGEFVEGLWKWDCGELFLFQPGTGRYLEINLCPSLAWWSCVFSSPRVRYSQCPAPLITPRALHNDSEWSAGFAISHGEIERSLGSTENLIGNVTLILGGCPDNDPPLQNLHSVADLGAVDFHRPHEWIPLERLLT